MSESLEAYRPGRRRGGAECLNEWLDLLAAAYVVGTPADDAGSDPFDYVPERLAESGPCPLHHPAPAMTCAAAK